MRALIATAEGRYTDPWHPFVETTQRLAETLTEAGFTTEVAPVDEALARIGDANLLAVNAGDPWRHDPLPLGAPVAAITGLDEALKRGIGVLAMHTSLSSLRDYPSWPIAVGGMWVPGLSMHPPISNATFSWAPHPLADTEPLTAFDERYAYMQQFGPRDVVAVHEHDGINHPVVWTRSHGNSRIAVDLLGHDARSYDSPAHHALITRLAHWAAGA
ncbi:ThuA domain-containing protein [Microbacterium amylolyticum]|uniref:Type 1 glutamine amidotransferase n=1 Tax=Microbacterium amylolyticum TaxID=936337 RepID=A0ABS4ZGH3_9MICO|nr:ThuA domain-containing protein [Microbacterium amylolyticum]MBP2436375.1 type 1 glutamine amidotransferase [Microbacterium amylolyticum]